MKIKFLILLVLLVLIRVSVYSAFEDKPTSARISSLGGAGTAIVNNSSELFYNPAAISLSQGLEFSAMDLKLYGMDELKYNFFNFTFPATPVGTFGVAYSQFGPLNYQENIVSVGYGLKINQLSFGLLFDFLNLEITDAGSANTFGIDVGVLYKANTKLSFGLSAKNINGATFGTYREGVPSRNQLGIGWRFSENALASLDLLNYSRDSNIYVVGGLELSYKWISFRGGMQFNPAMYSLGVGFGPEWLKIDYAYAMHNYLLSQNQFSVVWRVPLTFFRRRPTEEEGVIKTEVSPEELILPEEKIVPEGVSPEKVNINLSDEQQLLNVGFSKEAAKNIIRWRKRQGEFKQIEDIINVPGITFETLDKVRDKITVGAPPAQEESVPEEMKVLPSEQKIEPEIKKSTETPKAIKPKAPKTTKPEKQK